MDKDIRAAAEAASKKGVEIKVKTKIKAKPSKMAADKSCGSK